MPDRLRPILLILGVAALGACHNDPFSMKPDVNVTLPEKPPAEAAPADEDGASAPEESEPAS